MSVTKGGKPSVRRTEKLPLGFGRAIYDGSEQGAVSPTPKIIIFMCFC